MHSQNRGLVLNGVETWIRGNKIHDHHFQIETIHIFICRCPRKPPNWECTFEDGW